MNRVAVYTTRPVLAEGLRIILSGSADITGVFSSVSELKDRIYRDHAGILLLEATPDVTPETLSEMRQRFPDDRIVLWIDGIGAEFASQALACGVRGFLPMAGTKSAYLNCIQAVLAGEMWITGDLNMNLLCGRSIRLTPRESQLMGLLAQGLKNKEVAWALGVSEGTIKVYISRLFKKVGAADRFSLALMALRTLSATQGARRNLG